MNVQPLAGERKPGETDKAVLALNDYLRMGPGRSLRDLHERYCQQSANGAATEKPPTERLRTLAEWSSVFGWQERVNVYDAEQDAAKTTEIQRLRTEGLAADHERIRQLGRIWAALDGEFRDGAGLWYKDIKISAKGDTVDVDVFNAALLTQMRGILDDLAKETGGRKQAVEHSTPKDNPFKIEVEHINYRYGLASDGLADPQG